MKTKVCKFGGTSMANSNNITDIANIVNSDNTRKYVIVSAPGKRTGADRKITDMLYACYHEVELNGECADTFSKIRERYVEIVTDLKLDLDINSCLDEVEEGIKKYRTSDYAASRGEYLGGIIMSAVLGFEFVDPCDMIRFNDLGEFDADTTNELVAKRLSKVDYAVIPGFYGADSAGNIKTFSRGGSDVTGAIISRAVMANIYENWTDVNGFMTCDPRIVENPVHIESLSYKELRELAYMGANVLHPESIFPVRINNIPINIRNTFQPDHKGTMIVSERDKKKDNNLITGIAGKKGYSIVFIEKSMMNSELGFARRVLSAFEYYDVSFEHMPSGIDTLSIVVADTEITGKEDAIIDRLKKTVNPDHIELLTGFSIIATVGHDMSFVPGTASRLFAALAKQNINIRMIDQGSSEMNIIVGVNTPDYENAIKAIYSEFVK